MNGFPSYMLLGTAWGVITVILVALVIYRSVMGIHEQDRIFLGNAEAALQKEQASMLRRIGLLDQMIKVTSVLSGLLLLIMAGIWLYLGFYGPQQQ
jgi:hypothetical protein